MVSGSLIEEEHEWRFVAAIPPHVRGLLDNHPSRNYTEFLTGFSVPWAVLCDGDQFQESQFCRVFDLPLPEEKTAFAEMKTKAEARGVFTLSEDFEEFENLPFVAPHLQEANRAVGPSKTRQGRHIADPGPPGQADRGRHAEQAR